MTLTLSAPGPVVVDPTTVVVRSCGRDWTVVLEDGTLPSDAGRRDAAARSLAAAAAEVIGRGYNRVVPAAAVSPDRHGTDDVANRTDIDRLGVVGFTVRGLPTEIDPGTFCPACGRTQAEPSPDCPNR